MSDRGAAYYRCDECGSKWPYAVLAERGWCPCCREKEATATARNEALEEAAKVADYHGIPRTAADIRSLKRKE